MKLFRSYMAALLCLLCLAGCGQEKIPDREEQATASTREEQMAAPTVDWRTKGFAVPGEIQDKQSLWTTEYITWQHDAVSYEDAVPYTVDELGICNDKIYRLHRFQVQDGEETNYKYLLEKYDTSSMQTTVTELLPEELGVDGGIFAGVDILDEKNYALRIQKWEQEDSGFKQVIDYVVFTDLGENMIKADLLPAIRTEGFQDRLYQEIFCDNDKNCYIRAADSSSVPRYLAVFNPEGTLLAEYDAGDRNTIYKPFRMPQGELIFPVYYREDASTQLLWFDPKGKSFRVLAALEKELISQFYGMQGNELYYASYDLGIVKWDIASGERTLIFPFAENAVSSIHETMLVFREGQPPVFRMYSIINGKSEDWLAALSEQETEKPGVTQIVSLNGKSYCVQNASALATRSNPGFSFSYETCGEQDKDDFRTRILADMVAGKGPDILYVSLSDMRLMQKEGMLADLKELLPEELLDQVLPGIISQGTLDGVLVGLAPDTRIETLVTKKSIWNQDTWSLEDIIELLDTGDFTGVICQESMPFAPRAVLAWLTQCGLQDGSLIDPETQKSHFDSDLFLKILKIAKDYGVDDWRGTTTFLGTGGCVADFLGTGVERFNYLCERYGDELNMVGYPTVGSCGSYLASSGVLVVNRNTKNPGAVSAYMECLLSEEIQYPLHSWEIEDSVLKIRLEDVVIKDTENGTTASWKGIDLNLREDGTTPLNDYKNFLESCIPAPASYDDIIAIVWEEAQSYIGGDKTAEDVAWVIQNKIQLYLDEGAFLPED